jgi:phage-related minor tail protein
MAGNEVEIVIAADNRASRGFRSVTADALKMRRTVKLTGDEFSWSSDKMEKSTGRLTRAQSALSRKMDKLKAGFSGIGKSASGGGLGLESLAGKAGIAGAALAAVTVVATGLGAALDKTFERMDFGAKLEAQLAGFGTRVVEQAGETAAHVYAGAWGDNIGEVNNAVRRVFIDIGRGSDEWAERTTANVMAVAQAFDQDLGRVTASVGQLMRTGLAKDSDAALDVIARGMQLGVDRGDDLLDTVIEYSTQFRSMGLSAETAFGLLNQGLIAGARNSDLVADAIKEFSIEAISAGPKVSKGFEHIGLNAKDMAKAFAAGGTESSKALDEVFDRLRAIEDPVKRNAVAAELFGEKAKDLGDALYALDPSEAAKGLGDVAGAAQGVADALGDTPRAKIESFQRAIENVVVAGLADGIDMLTTAWERVEPYLSRAGDTILPVIGDGMQKIGEVLAPIMADVMDKLGEAMDNLRNSGVNWELVLKALGATLAVVAGIIGGAVVGSLWLFAEVIEKATALVGPLWTVFRHFVMGALDQLGLLLNGAVRAFGWIPEIGPRLKAAQAEFNRFKSHVNAQLNAIHDKKIRITVTQEYKSIGRADYRLQVPRAARAAGGVVGGAASGGPRSGPVLVGEQGPELVDLPAGSRVRSNPDTSRLMGGQGVAPVAVTVALEWVGGQATDEFFQWLRRNIKIRGGATAALGA